MRKVLFTTLFVLLFLVQTALAQTGEIFLPIVLKDSGTMTASYWAKLEITDGTTTVSLITPNNQTGFHLQSWRPQIIQPKGGGVYQNSDIAPGRNLVFAVGGTANEVFNLVINDYDQDALIEETQDLLRLLDKARNYSITDWQNDPVYLVARAQCETNTRYALIINYKIDELDNPYAQPFFTANNLAAMDNISLVVERNDWLANYPGTGECVQATSSYEWSISSEWEEIAVGGGENWGLDQATSGRIFAGNANTNIYYSDDDGDTWAVSSGLPAGVPRAIFVTSTGRILASDDTGFPNMFYSDNNGGAWAAVTAPPGRTVVIIQSTTGRLIAGRTSTNNIDYSDDDGDNWNTSLITSTLTDAVRGLVQTSTGRIFANGGGAIYYSDDDGATWLVSTTSGDQGWHIIVVNPTLTTERIVAIRATDIWYSDDDGDTWGVIPGVMPASTWYSMLQLVDGRILYGGDRLMISDDYGLSWTQFTSAIFNTAAINMIQSTTGRVLVADDQAVWAYDGIVSETMIGINTETCDKILIPNKQNVANFTHIFIDDGGVFGANLLPMTAFPVDLLPAVPVVNDAIYFGIDTTAENSGPFNNIAFDLSSIITLTSSYTITWEYWNGAWVALTVQDGTNPGTGALRRLGLRSVHFVSPFNWTTTAVNGVTGWWIRARLSALVGAITPPAQQNRAIYTAVLPYINIDDAQVSGDIPALLQINAINESDKDGPGGAGPDLYANRVIVGLRSLDRGSTFQAYLNCADEQNPVGVTVTLGVNTSFANLVEAPSGRYALYNPAGAEAMADRVTFELSPTIASHYYGTYHAFVRIEKAGLGDMQVRLQVATGSAAVSSTSPTSIPTTTQWIAVDLGQITIPAAGAMRLSELGDVTELRLQASSPTGTPNLEFYDLILIPTDEWSIDAVDMVNSSISDIGRSSDIQKYLDIDSITYPKYPVRSLVRVVNNNFVTAIYNSVTPGAAILQANKDQRLWFLAMYTNATGTSYYWLSDPAICHSIQLFKNERYLGLRGAR